MSASRGGRRIISPSSYKLVLPNGTEIDSQEPKDKSRLPFKTKVQVAVAKLCPGIDKVIQSRSVV